MEKTFRELIAVWLLFMFVIAAVILSLVFVFCIYKPHAAGASRFKKLIAAFFLSYIVIAGLIWSCITGRLMLATGLCTFIGWEFLIYCEL